MSRHPLPGRRIIFVDDEPLVLKGYERNFRGVLRGGYEAAYAGSGREALQMLAERPFDIVVSDMQMPGMNGAQLLNEVMLRYPRTIRIILSGHDDRDLIQQCLGSTHQFLAKPIDIGELEEVIQEVGVAGQGSEMEWIRRLTDRLDQLPSLPKTYQRLEEVMAAEDASLAEIGAVVAQDPAMTAQVLRLVNSTFFSLRRVVTTPEAAIAYLGVQNLRALVLAYGLFQQFDPLRFPWFKLDGLVQHSQRVAFGARAIARLEGASVRMQEEVLTAGMLHDLGILVLVSNFPSPYRKIYQAAEAQGHGLREAEQLDFRAAHPGIAGYLLNLWGVAPNIVEAVAFHHVPSLAGGGDFRPLTAIHIAEVLAADRAEGSRLDETFLAESRLNHSLPEWQAAFAEGFREVG